MKRRLFLIVMFAAITLSGMAQNIGEAFYIYRNDGQFNAFFRDEVLSIEYSYEDADGNTYDEIVTQIVNTADSVYKIPLAAIDSVGFVTPEPIYKENVRELSGDLLAYVISVDSLTIKLKGDIPENLLPLVNDKIVQLWYSDLCPNGFLGKVANINKGEDSYTLTCNYINIEDAVSRYYATYRLTTDNYSSQGIARRAGKVSSLELFHKIYEQENIPLHTSLEFLTNHLWKSKDEIAGVQLGGKGDMSFNIQPKFDIKVTFSMDDFLGIIPKYNLHASTTYNLTTDVQAVGEVQFEHKDGKMSLFPKLKPEIPLLGPIMFYWDFGLVATGSIEIGAGFSSTKSGWQIIDADYYPIYSTVLPPISFLKGRGGMSTNDLTWNYLVGNAEVKLGAYIEAGFSLFNSKVFKVGGDLSIGAKANAACEFNPVFWKQSEVTTDCYDNSRDNCKIGVTPFVGGNFYVSAADDRAKWTILGGDFDIPGISVESYLLPSFKNVILQQKEESRSSFHAKAEVEGGCIFPVQLGFALFGSDNKHIKTVLYEEKKYWKDNSFSSFEVDFIDIPLQDIYTIYPVVKLFNKNMLASPLSFIKNNGSATIQDFEQTNAQYSKAAFTNEDKKYDFCYNAAITVAIDDMTNVDDWGYVYEDPDGKIAHVSLKTHESPYTDTNYAFYRNEPTSTACLYSYVKYQGDEKYYYGEKTEYPLAYDKQPKATTLGVVEVGTTTAMVKCGYKEVAPWGGICGVEYWKDSNHQELLFETANVEIDVLLDNLTPETPYNYRAFIKVGEAYIWAEETKSFKTSEAQVQLCPDDHHPHMIDLGLPSGTKWACCNVGATKPEEYGGYYAWGETSEKGEYYHVDNYIYWNDLDGNGDWDEREFVDIGSDIAGTKYDAATVNWGSPWQMPSLAQCKELIEYCTSIWKTINNNNGKVITGPNGNSIFLPAAGARWSVLYNLGMRGYYWSSTVDESYMGSAYHLFYVSDLGILSEGKAGGTSVRAVCK